MLDNARQADVIKPAGLGARDSLRLEAGMPLYGHELTEEIDPLSVGLSFAVKLDKGQGENAAEPFIGQEALMEIAQHGPPQRLVGLQLEGRRTPRQHMAVLGGSDPIGEVTSGCLSPTFGYPIAMALVDSAFSGNEVSVDFGKNMQPATVTPLPFYRRKN